MRKWLITGVGVIVLLFGVAGAAVASLLPTRPIVVQSPSGPVMTCNPPETLHWILGQPFCW